VSREYLYRIPPRQMIAALLSGDPAGWDRARAVPDRVQKELYQIMAMELAHLAANATELAYGSREAARIVTVDSLEYWLDQAARDRRRQLTVIPGGAA
jgi:hypothetical protein